MNAKNNLINNYHFMQAVESGDLKRASFLLSNTPPSVLAMAMLDCCRDKNQVGFDFLLPVLPENVNENVLEQIFWGLVAWPNKNNLVSFLKYHKPSPDGLCLQKAISNNNEEAVKILVNHVSFKHLDYSFLLAASKGMLGLLKTIDNHTPRNTSLKDSLYDEALCEAAYNGHSKCVSYLIPKANIKPFKSPPLMMALNSGDEKTIDLLFDLIDGKDVKKYADENYSKIMMNEKSRAGFLYFMKKYQAKHSKNDLGKKIKHKNSTRISVSKVKKL